MLDEQSVQLSRRNVADLDWADFQNVAGLLESGQSRTKHDPDFARSGLASEMGRLAPDRLRNLHALLSEGFSPPACRDFASRRCANTWQNRERFSFLRNLTTRLMLHRNLSLTGFVFFLIVASFSASCASHPHKLGKGENYKPGGTWGYYSGPVDTRWNADGRTMTVLTELRYTDPQGVIWIAPAGSQIHGASMPRALWSFM